MQVVTEETFLLDFLIILKLQLQSKASASELLENHEEMVSE